MASIPADFRDRSIPGGVVYNPASPYAQEMAKWEMGYSPYGPPGRPREQVGHQEYPAMFYKVRRSDKPHELAAGPFVVEHYQAAGDAHEARNLQSRGYHLGRLAAEQAIEASENAMALAHAELNYADRNMSDKAKAEQDAFIMAQAKHVGEIPEQPVRRRRGRPRKNPITPAE